MYEAINDRFADPNIVSTHFHLREGDIVADFGAGSGHFMKPLSQAVGRDGQVYLCEIQKSLVESLGLRAQEARLTNVSVVWSDLEEYGGTKIEDNELDAGVISNVLFQISNKDAVFKEISRVMRPGSKLFIIDWTGSFGGLGPHPEHVVTEFDARKLAEKAGFTFDRSFPVGEHHYGIALRKA